MFPWQDRQNLLLTQQYISRMLSIQRQLRTLQHYNIIAVKNGYKLFI